MLRVSDLSAGYGRVPVLRGIDLHAEAGEIVLVLGPNGAGKSTLLRSVAGFIKPTSGSVSLAGRDITGIAPEEATRAGLRLVLDGHRVFPQLSVLDNIRLGASFRRDRRGADARAEPALAMFPILREKLHAPARNLSGGQQQMLALAQAFVAQPKVLLCDEPSLGLAQALLPPILNFLRRWAAQGTAVVIVEQQIEVALGIADKAVILEGGRIQMSGTAAALRSDPRVKEIYLGLEDRA
jgi:branched-chain amino acid transport system ATP-binding protein